MANRNVFQGSQIRIPRGSVSSWNSGSANALPHRHERCCMAAFHDHVDCPHKPIPALLGISFRAGVEGACGQVLKEWLPARNPARHCRGAHLDSQAWRVSGKKWRWLTRDSRVMERMEAAGGSHRGLVSCSSVTRFVGNRKRTDPYGRY